MKKNIEISVVIVSSKKEYLFGCLDSLIPSLKGIEAEIIIIDNASVDRIDELVSKKYPQVKVLRREKNGGFGENNNMGMRIAKGRYVLLLNDDTQIINKNIFKEMIAWMDDHPKVGVSSCGLVNPDKVTFQGSGGYYPTLLRVFAWMMFLDDIPGLSGIIKSYHPKMSYFKNEHKQDWVTGAFFLMRKKAMDEAGIFDEDFFLYVEEVELATRFVKKGWQVWYLPRWKTLHFGMSTNGSERATIFELQNLILLYKKQEPSWKIPILWLILKFGVVLRILIWSLSGRFNLVKIYAKAFVSF